jgi:putative endonuclease
VDKTLYTGMTEAVERRVKQHNQGTRGAKYTRTRRPVTLVYHKRYRTWKAAATEERRIKKLSKTKKIQLIDEKILPKGGA